MDATAFEIYYFDHPTCTSAEYKGDVLEIRTKDFYTQLFYQDGRFRGSQRNKAIEDFMNEVKANVPNKFGGSIICGGKLESSFYSYQSRSNIHYVALTMTFTGTAMKKAKD